MVKDIYNGIAFTLLLGLSIATSVAQTSLSPTSFNLKTLDEAVAFSRQGDVIASNNEKPLNTDTANLGSIQGRVFYGTATPTRTVGIGGVRIILHSMLPELRNFVREEVSSVDGTYNFQYLSPGKYKIEVDPASLPTNHKISDVTTSPLTVAPAAQIALDVPVVPLRVVSGIIFIDKDGNGRYKKDKDEPVAGASITAGGSLALSDANGAYVLRDLPPGRVGLVVRSARKHDNTHVLLDLGTGPVTTRVVNVPMLP